MTYKIGYKSTARKDIKKLPQPVQERIIQKIESLAKQPRPPGVKKLKAEDNVWRVRVGNYRILYAIHDEILLVLVVRVRQRKEAYKK